MLKTSVKEGEVITIVTKSGETVRLKVEQKNLNPNHPTFNIIFDADRSIQINREGNDRRNR